VILLRVFTPKSPWINAKETKIHLLGGKDIIFPAKTLEMYPTIHRVYGRCLHFNNSIISFLIAYVEGVGYCFILPEGYIHKLYSLPDDWKRKLH
jgi:hypothetical protein